MATFYVDFVTGNNANTGASWAQALATVAGVTSVKGLTGGDTVRVAKTDDKVSIGNGTWTTGPIPATKGITSSTNASPIQITISSHGYVTGDVVQITGHLVNTAANGTWIITNTGANTFTLDGSTGNGTGVATGTAQNINAKTVKLAASQTKTVFNCETQFTAVNSSMVSAQTTNYKQGNQSTQIQLPAAGVTTNTRYAYFTLPGGAQDFSAYQELSFWFFHQNFLNNNAFKVCLCSDTLGVTVVDEFLITAGALQNTFSPLSLARTGGGNLGASIQSIAIYTGTDVASSRIIVFDNFVACTTNGLNLTGLISPVASNTDPYDNYPIQSISETLVQIDQHYNNNAIQGRGYYGTTQTTTTYYRQPNKDVNLYSVEAASASLITPAVSPTDPSLPITWSAGWNTGTDTQDGMTVLLTLGGNSLWNLPSYTYLENWGVRGGGIAFRYAVGSFNSGSRFTNCFAAGQTSFGFNLALVFPTAATIGNGYASTKIINSGGTNTNGAGINFSGIMGVEIIGSKSNNSYNPPTLLNIGTSPVLIENFTSNNNVGYGLQLQQVSLANINTCSFAHNSTGGIFMQNSINNTFYDITTSNNGPTLSPPAGIIEVGGARNNRTVNLTANETVPYQAVANGGFSFTTNTNSNGLVEGWSTKGWLQKDSGTTHGSATYSWKYINIGSGSVSAIVNSPSILDLAQVYVFAGQSTTIKAWFNKSHATNISASLFIPKSPIYSTGNLTATAGNSTGWQEVSITFTPTATGVIQLQSNFWIASASVANNNLNCYVSDLSLPFGVNTANFSYDNLGAPWAQNQGGSSVAYGAVGL
jgi:hypothetical protein